MPPPGIPRHNVELEVDPETLESTFPIERCFWVGQFCALRLILYHSLYHWKWRLISRLKLELKKELNHRKKVSLCELAALCKS